MPKNPFVIVPPEPGALLESLRAFGYSPQAAIADLVDNSIAAGARTIQLDAHWDGDQSWFRVSDDGSGMDADGLNEAMKLGGNGPMVLRDEADLGRFGLGLKTASFSQCRHLTVCSISASGRANVRRWDLDYVKDTGQWRLLTTPLPDQRSILENPVAKGRAGTVVLWQHMDRIVGGTDVDDSQARSRFNEVLREIEQHLEMVFHRYMAGRGKIRLLVNGNLIKPWDPFQANEVATQQLPEECLWVGSERVMVQPYILPHVSRFSGRRSHERAGGIRGWNAHQGFWVYRNRRLLVAGEWLGLPFKKEEHYKLARIQVDIPNTLDQEWDIDVRKSRARPPASLRDDLLRIATTTRSRAVDVYRHRGKIMRKPRQEVYVDLWDRKVRSGKLHYSLNRDHPAIAQVLDEAPQHHLSIEVMLRLIEETVPTGMITIDHAERNDELGQPFENTDSKVLIDAGRRIMQMLRRQGLESGEAAGRLALIEPFQLRPEIVQILAEEQDGLADGFDQ